MPAKKKATTKKNIKKKIVKTKAIKKTTAKTKQITIAPTISFNKASNSLEAKPGLKLSTTIPNAKRPITADTTILEVIVGSSPTIPKFLSNTSKQSEN